MAWECSKRCPVGGPGHFGLGGGAPASRPKGQLLQGSDGLAGSLGNSITNKVKVGMQGWPGDVSSPQPAFGSSPVRLASPEPPPQFPLLVSFCPLAPCCPWATYVPALSPVENPTAVGPAPTRAAPNKFCLTVLHKYANSLTVSMCVHAHTHHIHVHTHTHPHAHACPHACTHVHVHTRTHVHVHACTLAHTHPSALMHAHTHVHVHACVPSRGSLGGPLTIFLLR